MHSPYVTSGVVPSQLPSTSGWRWYNFLSLSTLEDQDKTGSGRESEMHVYLLGCLRASGQQNGLDYESSPSYDLY